MVSKKETYLASMTNLSLCGLSENWLLKECGHQHWMALANHFGLDLPQFTGELFQTQNNTTIYAAFINATISNLTVDKIIEHDYFEISTQLVAIGKSKFFSLQTVTKNNIVIGDVELISTLVTRKESGNNQSVYRFSNLQNNLRNQNLKIKNTRNDEPIFNAENKVNQLLQISKDLKNTTPFVWQENLMTNINEKPDGNLKPYYYQPCPHSDFNGADFLYFANFQRIADQADWYYLNLLNHTQKNQLWLTKNRQICYYQNINLGDTLIYTLTHSVEKPTEYNKNENNKNENNKNENNQSKNNTVKITQMSVTRLSDHQKIADILTQKINHPAQHYRWANIH